MKSLLLFSFTAISFALTSCSHMIKRQAHFLPVFQGCVLLDGQERFVDTFSDYITIPDLIKRTPEEYRVRHLEDDSICVTWITSKKKPEKLVFFAAGLHPVSMPESEIQESTDLEREIPLGRPYVLKGFGPNTAYVREFLKLGRCVE